MFIFVVSGGNWGVGLGVRIIFEVFLGLLVEFLGVFGFGGSLGGFRNRRRSVVSLGKSFRWLVSITKNCSLG